MSLRSTLAFLMLAARFCNLLPCYCLIQPSHAGGFIDTFTVLIATKKNNEMKRMKEQRIMAVILGIVIVVIMVMQILQDGFEAINTGKVQQQVKTNIGR